MTRRIACAADIEEGLAALKRADSRLAAVIEAAGPVPLRQRSPGYDGLAAIIVSQMVSKASADAIWARLVEQAGHDGIVSAQRLLQLEDEHFRLVGLSRAKQTTLQGAAEASVAGTIDLDGLCHVPAEEAIAEMTGLKGIGPWTAEVYLLFCAGHGDIFPAGDIALQNAAAHAFSYAERPDQKALRALAERWSPWRSVAARLLWAYYAKAMKREVIPAGGEGV